MPHKPAGGTCPRSYAGRLRCLTGAIVSLTPQSAKILFPLASSPRQCSVIARHLGEFIHLSEKPTQQPPHVTLVDTARHSANHARLVKLIRVAVKQAQSEGEWDAANELLGILKGLNVSAPAIVASIAAFHKSFG